MSDSPNLREAMHDLGTAVLATGADRFVQRVICYALHTLTRALDTFTRWIQR